VSEDGDEAPFNVSLGPAAFLVPSGFWSRRCSARGLRYSEPMPATGATRPPARRLSALGAVTAMALAMALLAGCSSNDAATSTTSTTTAPATGVSAQSTVATTIPFSMARNARQDVTAGSCKEAGGLWVLSGTVKNSAKTARTYQIVVDFVNPVGNTVFDTKIVTTPSVRPAQSLAWSTNSVPGLTHVACVIRQVQAPA
jgi:hypothetical protein